MFYNRSDIFNNNAAKNEVGMRQNEICIRDDKNGKKRSAAYIMLTIIENEFKKSDNPLIK
jgi:hypothetical protein